MSNIHVYAGAVAPAALSVTVKTAASGIDMTTVTAVSFRVRQESGAYVDWATEIEPGATSGKLVATHTFAAGEIPTSAQLRVMPILTLPGGVRRCEPFALFVLE